MVLQYFVQIILQYFLLSANVTVEFKDHYQVNGQRNPTMLMSHNSQIMSKFVSALGKMKKHHHFKILCSEFRKS